MAQATETVKTSYQGQMHHLQKDMMGRYFERVTRAAENGEGKAVYMLISGNPVELIQAFDLIPVYPEIDALQLAAAVFCRNESGSPVPVVSFDTRLLAAARAENLPTFGDGEAA